MNRRWVIAAAAACAIALLTVPMMLRSEGSHDDAAAPPSGATCKADSSANLDLTLRDMNGSPVRLADFKGKVVLLNFWATWCGPCQIEIPDLIRTYDAYRDKGFVVLGVSIDDPPEALRAYASEKKMNYPVLQMQDDMEEAYGPIVGVPVSFIIARDGSICRKHYGPITMEQVEREIKSLL